MATKFRRNTIEKEFRRSSYRPIIYRQRSLSMFMLTLCMLVFIGSAYFLTISKGEEKNIYTEGIIVEKTSFPKTIEKSNDIPLYFLTLKFSLRSGRTITKEVPVDKESFEILKNGDTVPILYRYDHLSGEVEVISFGRYPLKGASD